MARERRRDPGLVVWWATEAECGSAVGGAEREGVISPTEAGVARERMSELTDLWREVAPGDPLRRTARRLLRTHSLSAAEALQLAGALAAADGEPGALELLTLDKRLAEAARREGFPVGPQQQV